MTQHMRPRAGKRPKWPLVGRRFYNGISHCLCGHPQLTPLTVSAVFWEYFLQTAVELQATSDEGEP